MQERSVHIEERPESNDDIPVLGQISLGEILAEDIDVQELITKWPM